MACHYDETPTKITVFFDEHRLDEISWFHAEEELNRLCRKSASEGKKFILCFKGVELITSAWIGAIVLMNKICSFHGQALAMSHVAPTVREIFEITRLHKMLMLFDDDA